MAMRRTQKEIQQVAPWWFLGLLIFCTVLMFIDAARNPATKQQFLRVWGATFAAPFESVASGVGGSGVGIVRRIANIKNAEAENFHLKERVEQLEIEVRQGRAAKDENE